MAKMVRVRHSTNEITRIHAKYVNEDAIFTVWALRHEIFRIILNVSKLNSWRLSSRPS